MSIDDTPRKAATRLVHSGREKSITGQFVNPPVVRASTVLFDTSDDLAHLRARYSYGRRGTPTSDSLEAAVSDLEGADGAVIVPSGLAAGTIALLSCLSAGDEVLITDSVYGPVRHFADAVLARLGITVTYYDPLIGAGIGALFNENTRAVYAELPGSVTFEMQDLPAIAAVAHAHNATVIVDNTWATPLFFRALDHGADISVIAATKYFGGHSDIMLGTIAARGDAWKRVKETHGDFGMFAGPDDMFLALRGLRTLAVRLRQHQESALKVASWLEARPEVERVLYPALPSDPGHALWKRDMTGACGLFGVTFGNWTEAQAMQFVDRLSLFGIGFSWGGFESLAILQKPAGMRTATRWSTSAPLIRLHIGLEDVDDLIADLDQSLAAVAAG